MAVLATGALVLGGMAALLASGLAHELESAEADARADEAEDVVAGA